MEARSFGPGGRVLFEFGVELGDPALLLGLLVDALSSHAHRVTDLLPGKPEGASALDMEASLGIHGSINEEAND